MLAESPEFINQKREKEVPESAGCVCKFLALEAWVPITHVCQTELVKNKRVNEMRGESLVGRIFN